MIYIALLTGPYAGEVYASDDVLLQGETPSECLSRFVRKDWRWQIMWPPKPTEVTALATEWVDDQLRMLREDFGIDLTDRTIIFAETPSIEEVMEWSLADLSNRIVMAALQGRAIRFQGKRLQLPNVKTNPHKFSEMIGEIEDSIAESDHLFGIFLDDGTNDLVIGEHTELEPPA